MVRSLVRLVAVISLLLVAARAEAIPAFARKYQLGCSMCHTIFPQLNRFGRDFRDNGFRMPDEVQSLMKKANPTPAPSHGTGSTSSDFWSFIPEAIPFSIQGKLHDLINPTGTIKNDFELEELQLQSGGTFTPRVSYYLHHHLVEEGAPGTLYTAWVRFNDLWGSDWLNVTVGQVELPLSFSPEIERLSSFEYLAFDRQLGANPFTIGTPQLGLQVFGQSEHGTKLWAGVVNGSGLAVSDATGTVDSNNFKDVYVRLAQEVGRNVYGGFAYFGRAGVSSDSATTVNDDFVRIGADAVLSFDPVQVSAMAMYARDGNPLGTGERRSFVGGFLQGQWFATDRTIVLVRVDAIHQNQPAPDVGADAETSVFRVNTLAVTPGVQFLVRPNVKIGFEYQVRQARAEDRAIGQLHISF